MALHSFSERSGRVVTCGPTKAIFRFGFASFILVTSLMSPGNPGVDVNSTRNSYCLPSSIVSSADTWCGGASSSREPSSIPAGYASHTGYQYDSISRVAGQRELAPPSKFSNDGGFRNNVFNGMSVLRFILTSFAAPYSPENPSGYKRRANGRLAHWAARGLRSCRCVPEPLSVCADGPSSFCSRSHGLGAQAGLAPESSNQASPRPNRPIVALMAHHH